MDIQDTSPHYRSLLDLLSIYRSKLAHHEQETVRARTQIVSIESILHNWSESEDKYNQSSIEYSYNTRVGGGIIPPRVGGKEDSFPPHSTPISGFKRDSHITDEPQKLLQPSLSVKECDVEISDTHEGLRKESVKAQFPHERLAEMRDLGWKNSSPNSLELFHRQLSHNDTDNTTIKGTSDISISTELSVQSDTQPENSVQETVPAPDNSSTVTDDVINHYRIKQSMIGRKTAKYLGVNMLPEYDVLPRLTAVQKALKKHSGTALHVNYIVAELYGSLDDKDKEVATVRVRDALGRGWKKGLFDRVPRDPGYYTFSVKLLDKK